MLFLLFAGLLCVAYDITLICLNPGTFLDNLFSFTHIWSALGAYLVFLAIYRKKTGHSFWSTFSRRVKIAVGAVLSAGAVIAVINLAFILTPRITPLSEEADYVLLLGGGISKDGVLPKSVMARVEKTAEYMNAHPDTICVVTGGTLYWLPCPEAPEMKRQLVLAGVEEHRILTEDQALDTIQNLELSCQLLSETLGVSKQTILESRVIIVTSRFHLHRAELLASRLGYTNTDGISAHCPVIYLPHNYVREICAYVKLSLRILLTGKPHQIILR